MARRRRRCLTLSSAVHPSSYGAQAPPPLSQKSMSMEELLFDPILGFETGQILRGMHVSTEGVATARVRQR